MRDNRSSRCGPLGIWRANIDCRRHRRSTGFLCQVVRGTARDRKPGHDRLAKDDQANGDHPGNQYDLYLDCHDLFSPQSDIREA